MRASGLNDPRRLRRMSDADAEAYLVAHAPTTSVTELAIRIGISGPEVRKRCNELGIRWYTPPFTWEVPANARENFEPTIPADRKRLTSEPGSAQRIEDYRKRAEDGEPIFDEEDRLPMRVKWGDWE